MLLCWCQSLPLLLLAALLNAAAPASAQVTCSGDCVGTYQKCSGKSIDTQLPCCSEDDQCVFKNDFYSQCRPISKGVPSRWSGGIVLGDCCMPGSDNKDVDDHSVCELDSLAELSVMTPEYDPTLVDWRSAQKAIEYIANKEKRFCNFAVRAHFHDAGSLGDVPGEPAVRGSDGSLLLDKFEFLQPENAYDAFALFARVVLKEFTRFYDASFADLLNLAAFTCVENLGGIVSIPETCASKDLDLMVGKLDADFAFSKDAARDRVDNLPGPFQETPIWVNFWLNTLNAAAESEKWYFNIKEGLALMGSHTLIDNQACTTSGKQIPSANDPDGSLLDEDCGGNKRVFEWSNSYFVDATSGSCKPRGVSPESAEWFVTSLDNSKGRQPNDAEDEQLAQCPWSTPVGQQMGNNLECVVVKGAAEYDIGVIPEDNDFRFTDWTPDENRAPCCGYHCQTCPGGLNDEANPYYCANNSPKGTSFWFYTWQDCDMIDATRMPDTYCDQDFVDCSRYPNGDLKQQLGTMSEAYQQFSRDSIAWQKEYAYGHCKLNNLAAVYSPNKVRLLPLLKECKGAMDGEVCSTDPVNGVVNASSAACCGDNCGGSFDLTSIISKNTCSSCSEQVEAVEVPEDGELDIGEDVEMAPGVTTRVADVGGD